MKYLIKAVTTNNRDLKTALLFTIEERSYLFNCPDGFQRVALSNKVKFKGVRYVFLSGIQADYYGGFPGFYLSSRESSSGTIADLQAFKIGVIGPAKIKEFITQGRCFYGGLNFIEIFQYGKLDRFYTEQFQNGQFTPKISKHDPNNLQTEKSKKAKAQQQQLQSNQEEEKKSYEIQQELEESQEECHEFQDNYLKVIPIKVYSSDHTELESYSFICVPKQNRGKFLPKKAIELGADPKFHFKILNEGNTVTLADGSIIYPYQCTDNPLPSQSFIFVFIPNKNYLESFLSPENKQLFEQFYFENIDQKCNQIHLIYHSVAFEVLMNKDYRDFMRQFGLNVKHVVDCEEVNDEVQMKVKGYQLSSRHALVCPTLIPLSKMAIQRHQEEAKTQLAEFHQVYNLLISQVGQVFNLYPINSSNVVDNSQVIQLKDLYTEEDESLNTEMQQLIKSLLKLKKNEDPNMDLEQYTQLDNSIDDTEPSILFLGTSSMKPTTYRGASAIYVFIKGSGILMDSAEGSYGQLYDHFQKKEIVDEHILKLRVIFITHIHGDHQLGVLKIMAERDKLFNMAEPGNELYVVTPQPMWDYMTDYINSALRYPTMVKLVKISDLNPEPQLYYDNESPQYNPKQPHIKEGSQLFKRKYSKTSVILCPVRSYEEVNQMIENHQPNHQVSQEMLRMLNEKMNITHMNAIEVNHCVESFACLFGSPDFGRIFYSGDTLPCQTVINYGQNVKLLIHEATFDDALEADAKSKKHTTVGQAIEIARKCKPWRTVLTHFSPRYQKIGEIDKRHQEHRIMVAFDHLRFKLSYLEWAYKFLPIYSNFFTNESTDSEAQYDKSRDFMLQKQKEINDINIQQIQKTQNSTTANAENKKQ
ncbi:zinc phosphodiesterase elac [Stylonychia lemnae]|uniref:ribonuclease Z n=1 Tax=Stylonychia lemnae TaxID=5949 RepID=A0A078AAN7_STYLE|nr:zinc phosphodiesterase elac [Stylonychia lemnae]|eukprot:CDW79345.1 zinc phosphodiesterase elac [Stylonychia lemnae]